MPDQDVIEAERMHLEDRINFWEKMKREADAVLPLLRRALSVMSDNDKPTDNSPAATAPSTKTYRGVETVEAVVDYLTRRGKPATTGEIADGLLAGGWRSKAKRKSATVFGILSQHLKNPGAKVCKTGPGTWGLIQWGSGQHSRDGSENGAPVGGAQ